MKISYIFGICLFAGLCSCASNHTETTFLEANTEKDLIILQDLRTREIAECKTIGRIAAEDCAVALEEQGFVRLTDIPQQTANYDLLKTNTYPSRRWREGEKSPRW